MVKVDVRTLRTQGSARGVLEEAARSAADGGAKMLVLAVTDGNGTVLASAALGPGQSRSEEITDELLALPTR